MSLGLTGHIAGTVRSATAPQWFMLQGLLRSRRVSLPRPLGCYNLYRGPSRETVDFDVPVGQAAAGAATVTEFSGLHPTGTGAYVYCVRGVGPGGQETEAHDTAHYEVDYVDGVRTSPAPAPVASIAAQPYAGGQALLTVVVDQSLGRVPAATLCVWAGPVGGTLELWSVPVPSAPGWHVVQFVVPRFFVVAYPPPPEIASSWLVEPVSAESVVGEPSATVPVLLDGQGPPAVSGFIVECQPDVP